MKTNNTKDRAAEIKAITEKLERGVKETFTSEKYKAYLSFMSKFHNYSFNNSMLIMLQNPEATLVAGYKAWQTKFKRQVKKGEHGIKILAPCPHKKEIEEDDGSTKIVAWTTYRAVTVFDIAQTDGEDVPSVCERLSGGVQDFESLKQKLEDVAPVPVSYEDFNDSANGYFSPSEEIIVIKSGMSELQTIKTLIHEISHSMLHNEDGEEKEAARNTKEVQAESVAFTVCSALGLDTSDYSFGYVAGWSEGQDIKTLSDNMEVIRKNASEIIEALAA